VTMLLNNSIYQWFEKMVLSSNLLSLQNALKSIEVRWPMVFFSYGALPLVVAREGKSTFEEYLRSGNINLGIKFRVKVLTTPFWPTFQLYSQPNLPSDIANCVQVFKAY